MVDIEKVIPLNHKVVVRLLGLDEVYEDVITQAQSTEDSIAIRYGEVLSLGPMVDEAEHCSGLNVGDVVIFTQFAGHYIAANDGNINKVLNGYDIIGKAMSKKEFKDHEKLTPTANRLSVKVMVNNEDDEGIIIDSSDPTLADLTYGIITGVGTDVVNKKLKKGILVAFPPYVGTTIRAFESNDKPELKIIVEHDILFLA